MFYIDLWVKSKEDVTGTVKMAILPENILCVEEVISEAWCITKYSGDVPVAEITYLNGNDIRQLYTREKFNSLMERLEAFEHVSN